MLIAQITDLHLGFERDNPGEMNRLRLDQLVRHLSTMDPRPDLLICSGDLTDRGDLASYQRLREALAPLPFPYFLTVGNHDLRGPLREVFPDTPTASGFVQYAIEGHPVRIIVIDTLEENRHAGAFGPERARWLDAKLAEQPDKPTLLVLHHPPVVTGIEWMTLVPEETWAPRLTGIVARHKQVVGAICGHVHRPIVAPWAGTILRICPSCAPQVTLDLRPMDLEHPDDRPLIQEEPPAFALHMWTPGGLVTHYGRVEYPATLLRFDSGFQPVLKHFAEERGTEPKYPRLVAPSPRAGIVVIVGAAVAKGVSFEGRIRRRDFWLWMLGLLVAGAAITPIARMFLPWWLTTDAFTLHIGDGDLGLGPRLTVALLAWPALAVMARREHDRGRSGWWLLFLLVPFVGFLFWLIELGMLKGTAGANRFGASPKDS
jgi:Icc protein